MIVFFFPHMYTNDTRSTIYYTKTTSSFCFYKESKEVLLGSARCCDCVHIVIDTIIVVQYCHTVLCRCSLEQIIFILARFVTCCHARTFSQIYRDSVQRPPVSPVFQLLPPPPPPLCPPPCSPPPPLFPSFVLFCCCLLLVLLSLLLLPLVLVLLLLLSPPSLLLLFFCSCYCSYWCSFVRVLVLVGVVVGFDVGVGGIVVVGFGVGVGVAVVVDAAAAAAALLLLSLPEYIPGILHGQYGYRAVAVALY